MTPDWLLFPAWGTLILASLEDVESMSVPRGVLLVGWAFAAMSSLIRGSSPYAIALLLLVTLWGLGYGRGYLALLAAPFALTWPVLLLGGGAREGIVGESEVVAVSMVSLFSPWAGWCALAGLLLWHKFQRQRGKLWTPALPGVLVGIVAYFAVSLYL